MRSMRVSCACRYSFGVANRVVILFIRNQAQTPCAQPRHLYRRMIHACQTEDHVQRTCRQLRDNLLLFNGCAPNAMQEIELYVRDAATFKSNQAPDKVRESLSREY